MLNNIALIAKIGEKITIGKIKTIFQMVAIILLLGVGLGDGNLVVVGYALLYLAAGLTLLSMLQYLRVAWPDLYSGMKNEPVE